MGRATPGKHYATIATISFILNGRAQAPTPAARLCGSYVAQEALPFMGDYNFLEIPFTPVRSDEPALSIAGPRAARK